MNYSNPILICDENEEFRILIRDMLTKNGFFHVLEASGSHEAKVLLDEKSEYFVIMDSKIVSAEIIKKLSKQKNFIIFIENSDPKAYQLAARLGVDHLMTYPFHSKKLISKINSLL